MATTDSNLSKAIVLAEAEVKHCRKNRMFVTAGLTRMNINLVKSNPKKFKKQFIEMYLKNDNSK